MPCHVRSASAPRKRRRPSLTPSLLSAVAIFDLTDQTEREMHAIIERFHTGRWPIFRCHAMRRVGSVIYEVVQWTPARVSRPPAHALVTWDLTTLGLRWRDCPTLAAALDAFAAAVGNAAAPKAAGAA